MQMSLTPLHLINTRLITYLLCLAFISPNYPSHKVYGIHAACMASRVTPQPMYANHILDSPVLHVVLARLFVFESRRYVTAAFSSASSTASAKANLGSVLHSQLASSESPLLLLSFLSSFLPRCLCACNIVYSISVCLRFQLSSVVSGVVYCTPLVPSGLCRAVPKRLGMHQIPSVVNLAPLASSKQWR